MHVPLNTSHSNSSEQQVLGQGTQIQLDGWVGLIQTSECAMDQEL